MKMDSACFYKVMTRPTHQLLAHNLKYRRETHLPKEVNAQTANQIIMITVPASSLKRDEKLNLSIIQGNTN
jgi:hypothetical protein